MVNWNEPKVLLRCLRMLELSCYPFLGLYTWECYVCWKYDWDHISGKRRFRWTFIPYFIPRISLLLALIFTIRALNVWEPIDCGTWNRLYFVLYQVSLGCSSLLILLRLAAISNNSIWIMVPMGLFYLTSLGFQAFGVSRLSGVYEATLDVCRTTETSQQRIGILVTFAFDVSCLLVMFAMLLRQRGDRLWHLLVTQGVVYFIVTALGYLPTVVLNILNLNDPMNLMAETATVAIVTVTAQRMYRNLSDFGRNPDSGVVPMSRMNRHNGSYSEPYGTQGIAISVQQDVHKVEDYKRSLGPGSFDNLKSAAGRGQYPRDAEYGTV
jgi:hypothetical protein